MTPRKRFWQTFYKIHDKLYISGIISEKNLDEAAELGITAIVNLMTEQLYDPRPRMDFLHCGFKDQIYIPHKVLHRIYSFIEEHIKDGIVLVHCAQGVSRSGGIIVGRLLIENSDWTWSDALEFARKARDIQPDKHINESILNYLESIEGRRRE